MSQSPDDAIIEGEVVEDGPATPLPAPTTAAAPDYTDGGVPTFDYVRDQIEGRVATSAGAAELAADTPESASLDDQFAAREQAGKDRLEQIRRAMRGD